MLQLHEIEKKYGNQHVLEPISLHAAEGQFLTLLGPSGCGKTTLLRIIAGLEQPNSGTIVLAGKEITGLPAYSRSVNMIFQHYALFPHMTVEENIGFGLRMKKIAVGEQKKRVQQLVELTELGDYLKRKPHQLSGGQQQRVAIARALVNQPQVLLLDEPLAALDLKLRQQLQLELKSLQKSLGMTFIFVTHDQEEAMAMSDVIAVMNNGICEQIGSAQDIYIRPASRFVATFIGENNVVNRAGNTIAIRPEHIQLTLQNEQPNTTDVGSEDERCYEGSVADTLYLGGVVKVFVLEKLTGQSFLIYGYGRNNKEWKPGMAVRFRWSVRDEVILSS